MPHASIWITHPIMGDFSVTRDPIFPHPDLPPKEVLPTSLPRNFNIPNSDGTSPPQSPCPCPAHRRRRRRRRKRKRKRREGGRNMRKEEEEEDKDEEEEESAGEAQRRAQRHPKNSGADN